jgi:hypothetical protein
LYGCEQSGKIQFGYIYGVAMLGCGGLYAVLNLMLTDGRGAALSLVASTLGYCLLPMVGLSCVGILISLKFGFLETRKRILTQGRPPGVSLDRC